MVILNYIDWIDGIVALIALTVIIILHICYVNSSNKSIKNIKLCILSICSLGCVLLLGILTLYKISMEENAAGIINRAICAEQIEGRFVKSDRNGLEGTISLATKDICQEGVFYGSNDIQINGYIEARIIPYETNDSDYSSGDAASDAAKAAISLYHYSTVYKMYYIADVSYNGELVSFNILSAEEENR